MCRALLSGFLHHLENVILFIRTQVAFEMNFCISVQECPADYLDTPKQALSANSCTTYSYEATYTLKRSGAEKFDQNHFLVSCTRSIRLNFCDSLLPAPEPPAPLTYCPRDIAPVTSCPTKSCPTKSCPTDLLPHDVLPH